MDEVEHYDPTIVYQPGKLQVVSDTLSCMASQSEGEPANTDRFMVVEMENTLFTADEHNPPPAGMNDVWTDDHRFNYGDNPEINHTNHNSSYYCRIQQYLEKRAKLDDMDKKFKNECEKYELRDGILYNVCTDRCVILDLEFIKEILKYAHKDIGYYGKWTTSKAVA